MPMRQQNTSYIIMHIVFIMLSITRLPCCLCLDADSDYIQLPEKEIGGIQKIKMPPELQKEALDPAVSFLLSSLFILLFKAP